MKKSVFNLLLVFVFLFNLFQVGSITTFALSSEKNAYAASIHGSKLYNSYDEIDSSNLYLKKNGRFKYVSSGSGDRDYEETYYYDDTYFLNSSYVYNESLATMSLCFAMASGGSKEKTYAFKSDNAKDLLTQTGFLQFDTNYWYTVKPTTDSIGVVAANKKIKVNKKDYTLIAVGVRGSGYEQEWASNFTMGKSGQHQGFNEAKDNVLAFIEKYILDKNISGNIKLWITGYSRAGATANLVAGAIDGGQTFKNCSLNLSDLYAYTFGTPRGAVAVDATKNPVYKNIFNIINPNDPVPKVAPSFFKFKRYGVDKILPCAATDENYSDRQNKMLRIYNTLESVDKPYCVDDFTMKEIALEFDYTEFAFTPSITDSKRSNCTQSVFLDRLITILAKEQFRSRSKYVDEFQEGIREVFKVLEGKKEDVDGKQGDKWAKFMELFENKLKSNIDELIISTKYVDEETVESTVELVEACAVESFNEAGIANFNKDDIHNFALAIAETIIDFVVSHPDLAATLVCNIEGMSSAHYPELCLAWMQSMDENYTTNAEKGFSAGSYRIIKINCSVDVEVYDDSNMLVAKMKSDSPQTVKESSIIASINEDDEMFIYLPTTSEYTLKIKPEGFCYMTYSINEHNSEVGDVNRTVNYHYLAFGDDDVLTSNIPAYSNDDITRGTENGSNTIYSLVDSSNEAVEVSDDLRGTKAQNAYYKGSSF